jgi:L-ascorbate metabolism protein UlaG (beta-lactamase superfamily)
MSISKKPSKNEIYFTWFNRYSGITVKTPSKTVVIDPVDVKPRDFKVVDAVLVTHEHYDHLDQSLVAELQKLAQCHIFQTIAKRNPVGKTAGSQARLRD